MGLRFAREADWLLLWLLGVGAAAWLLYRREGSGIPRWLRMLMAGLRAAALGLILALLFEPVLAVQRSSAREAAVAVLTDRSLSMGVTADEYVDPEELLALGRLCGVVDASAKAGALPPETDARLKALTRAEAAIAALDGPLGIGKRLEELHPVRRFCFDAGIAPWPEGGPTGAPSGAATRLGDALRRAASEFRGKPLAGIVLLTDGRNTAGEDPETAARALADLRPAVPVFPVGIGESRPPRDIRLAAMAADAIAIKGGDPMVFKAEVAATGFAGEHAEVTLSRGETVVARQDVVLPADGEPLQVTMTNVPDQEGLYTFRMAVTPLAGELSRENNAASQAVKVISEKIKVCFLDERPRWDYRKLKSFLVRNTRFYESSCLLFGADPSFPQEGSRRIREFYPDLTELTQAVDVLVIGDVDPSRFTKTQMEAIVRFCEMGGGVVFEAGEMFQPAAYRGTPLERLLPLRASPENWDRRILLEAVRESYPLKLTAIGEQHPLLRIFEGSTEENRRYWEALQGQYWFCPIEQLKPAAVPLAVHPLRKTKQGDPYPLIVHTRYGAGAALFLAFDSTWRWSYGDPQEAAFQRFWGQVLRRMAENRLLGGTNRATVTTNASAYALGDRVVLAARVLDTSFEPLKQDGVRVLVQGPDGIPQAVALGRNAATGEFEGTWTASRQGPHEAWLEASSAGGAESKRTAFGVRLVTEEFRDPRMDRAGLERLAELTGGRFCTLGDLPELVKAIRAHSETFVVEEKLPVWDSPWVLGTIVGLLSLEWILRKWMRLM